jgi:ribonuclease HI
MSDDPHALKLYIDGSCYKNPGGTGACACVAKFPESWNREDEPIFQEGFHETTNNRMELTACIRAFEYVADQGHALKVQRVIIVTDSLCVYDNYNRAAEWRRNGWNNWSGRPIENSDLWKRFLMVRSKVVVRTEIHWRKGKKTSVLKAVDRAAKEAGKNPIRIDRGFRPGKVAKSTVSGGSSSMYVASGQRATIRVYRSGIIRKTGHKIMFDVFDEDLKSYVQKCHAYARAAIAAQLHRQHCYRVRFNTDPKHPLIEELIDELSCAAGGEK